MNEVFFGDCRDTMRRLIAEGTKVNCIVTSPPYWGLRDYGIPPSVWGGLAHCEHDWHTEVINTEVGKGNWTQAENGRGEVQRSTQEARATVITGKQKRGFCRKCNAWLGCLGLEPDFRMFITHMVEVFDLARELLTDDGVCWLNMGDSYSNDGKWGGETGGKQAYLDGENRKRVGREKRHSGLKPKDMCLIPDRLGIALQDAGWWVRSKLPWIKRNGMPESTTDRPAQSVEYVFMLTKRARYFYDHEAVKVKSSGGTHELRTWKTPDGWDTSAGDGGHGSYHKEGREKGSVRSRADSFKREDSKRQEVIPGQSVGTHRPDREESTWDVSARNFRVTDLFFQSWQGLWTDDTGEPLALIVNTKGYKEAHFATFPPGLIKPLILAATSVHGHCSQCGAGWTRVTTKGKPDLAHQQSCGGNVDGEYHGEAVKDYAGTGAQDASEVKGRILDGMRKSITTGWVPGCKCGVEAVPGVVFDPFIGSGTTGAVAQELGRNWLGCDMNPSYGPMQDNRTRQMGLPV